MGGGRKEGEEIGKERERGGWGERESKNINRGEAEMEERKRIGENIK